MLYFRANSSQASLADDSGQESSNLFAGNPQTDDVIQRLIEHAQNVAFWVAAEIVSCGSQKVQQIRRKSFEISFQLQRIIGLIFFVLYRCK